MAKWSATAQVQASKKLANRKITITLTEDQVRFLVECLQDHELKTGYETRLSIKLKNTLAKAKS